MTGFMDMQYATGDGSSLSRIMKSILSPSGTATLRYVHGYGKA